MTMPVFRRAVIADLPAIVGLLADDELSRSREEPGLPLSPHYVAAYTAIDADLNQLLVVAEAGRCVVGCLQLTFIPGLARLGMLRGQIEAVRIAQGSRGGGIGRKMLIWATEECRRRGCGLVQLTTDRKRLDARRFYAALGFVTSHEGMKLTL